MINEEKSETVLDKNISDLYGFGMRISTRARYALRLMVDLVRHYDGSRPVHLRKIAEDNDLSHGYLEQLMISLRNASLVRGLSGRKGGYVLARPAEEITLAEIVEAAIGPINVVDCVTFPENCPQSSECKTRPIWVLINHAVRDVLCSYTLAQISEDKWVDKMYKKFSSILGDPEAALQGFSRAHGGNKMTGVCGRPAFSPEPKKKKTRATKSKKSTK